MMETRSVQSQRIQHGKNAIVIGASMAGLLVGRVLSDFYERVQLSNETRLNRAAMYEREFLRAATSMLS